MKQMQITNITGIARRTLIVVVAAVVELEGVVGTANILKYRNQ